MAFIDGPTVYEQKELKAISDWKKSEPGAIGKFLGKMTAPVLAMADKLVPQSVLESALSLANNAGAGLADKNTVLRAANRHEVKDLKEFTLEECDKLADKMHNEAIALASVEGGAAGLGGAMSMAFDIPALLTLAVRTVYKIGYCYGYEFSLEEGKVMVLSIISAASANTAAEKLEAVGILHGLSREAVDNAMRRAAHKAIQTKYGKKYLMAAINPLAKQLGENLTKRKLMSSVPVIGAVVGAAVNASYIRDIGWAARRTFQERWLLENRNILNEDAEN